MPEPTQIRQRQRERAQRLLDDAEYNLRLLTVERLNLSPQTRSAICQAIDSVISANSKLADQPCSDSTSSPS